MTTAEIEGFLAVCEMKNVSKAAEKLFISQSSLSTKLKTLEREVGCTLLVRGKGQRALELTPEGEEFYQLACRYRELVRQMRTVGSRRTDRRLRVSSMNSVGTYLMTPVYERLVQQNRDIVLEVQEMNAVTACGSLARGETDLAFTSVDRLYQGVRHEVALWEPMLLVCARNADYGDGVAVAELDVKKEVFTGWSPEFVAWRQSVFGGQSAPMVQVEMVSQMLRFLSRSGGWAIAPASVAWGLAADGDLECRTLGFRVPRRATYCLYTPDSIRKEHSGRFLRCLNEYLQELLHRGCPLEICEDFFDNYALK